MAFTLAHLSDPHLPPLPAARLRDLASKRALGYLNWTRNRHKYHRREVLDALVADIQAQQPDHIAVTGDLVNLALEAEFAPSRAWLESVGDAAARHRHPRQSRCLCARHKASLGGSVATTICAATRRRQRRVSLRAPARTAGADRRVLRGADAAADGDGKARARAAARRSTGCWRSSPASRHFACCWCIIPCTRRLAVKRLTDSRQLARADQAARRGTGAARARPHPFDDVAGRPARRNSRDRRAVGVGDCAWALSGRGFQSVLDRARGRRVALRADRARRSTATCR